MPDSDGAPPPSVLAAFGVREAPERLPGGFDGAWRAGDVVLKRSRASDAALEAEFRALGAVPQRALRIQRLRRASDGSLRADGWIARDYLVGRAAPTRWREVLDVGGILNAALSVVGLEAAEPMIVGRTDPWARADRIAWDEEPIPDDPAFRASPLPEMLAARRPVDLPAQLVHGDLAGNVLFEDRLPPAVIDFSPYWRPALWAQSVVVGDCVMWLRAPLDLLDAIADQPHAGQCLVRALVFRHVTGLLLGRGPSSRSGAARYRALVEAALSLC